jgi:hypothetical protein
MANKHLWRKPHHVTDNFRWYEESHGIELIVEEYNGLATKVLRIPWRSIRAALARKDKS